MPLLRAGFCTLNSYLDPTIFDLYFIAFYRTFLVGEAFARADVKAPAVPIAFDYSAVKAGVGEGIALVRTEILNGVECAADVVESEFGTVL